MLSSENKQKFKMIGYLSPVAFSFVALFAGGMWVPVVGSAIGGVANALAEISEKDKLINQYNKCVEKALKQTKKTINSPDLVRMLQNFSSEDVVQESLDVLIQKTDAYRARYCTSKEVNEIIEIFNKFFLEEVASHQELNNFHILNSNKITLEKLKEICDIINDNKKKIDTMSQEVSKISKVVDKCETIVKKGLQVVGNALIAFCSFILLGLILPTLYENRLTVLLSFIFGEIIVEYSYEKFNYFIFKNKKLTNILEMLCKVLMQTAIVVSVTYVMSEETISIDIKETLIYFAEVVVGLLVTKIITYPKSRDNINFTISKIMKVVEKDMSNFINKEKIEIIANMLGDNIEIEKIAKYTGFSIEEVEKIKKLNCLNLDDL